VNGYETMLTHAATALPGDVAAHKVGGAHESLGAFKDFALGEMKFPEMKIGELAAKAEDWQSKMTGEIGAKVQAELQKVAPVAESAASVAAQMAAFAEKNWPKPPPIRVPPSPLPPIKKKAPMPPPIRPRADLRRD
jgi:hypothetical protein